MAEQVPYGVAASLIHRLASAYLREFGLIHCVTDELQRRKNTIESIDIVLLDVDEKQEQVHAVQIWIRRLKEMLHPTVIEDMGYKVDAGQEKKAAEIFHSFSSSNRIAFQMDDEIRKSRETFNDVAV